MELRQLRYVVMIAEELHFGRAAQRAHITASALSQQVARLERELGVQLFDRAPRRVALTPAGEAFVDAARGVLSAVRNATEVARAAADVLGGTLTVGFTSHGGGGLMTRILQRYADAYPGVTVRLKEVDFVGHFTALEDQTVDVMFQRGPAAVVPGIRYVTLLVEPRVVALPIRHPLAQDAARSSGQDGARHVVKADVLAGQTFFRLSDRVPQAWASHFAPWGVQADSPLVNTIGEALTCVASGAGVALLPESLAELLPRPDVIYRAAEVEPSALGVGWRPSRTGDAFAAISAELATAEHSRGDLPGTREIVTP